MRKAVFIGIAVLAALALSVGAFAYPAVMGIHPAATAHSSAPATGSHPRGDDNSTGNQTNENETGDHESPPAGNETENETGDNETTPPPPEANETENETENGSSMGAMVEHNVTVAHSDNTTWVNGTIIVVRGNVTLVDISFQLVVHDNGTANVTFHGTRTIGNVTVTIDGAAVFDPEHRTVLVMGTVKATQAGAVQWERTFGFELPLSGSCQE